MNGSAFDYTGYVESINIKGIGSGASHQFLFSVVNSGGHQSFLLDTSAPSRYGAMVSVLTAAYASGNIVQLNTTPNSGGGQPFASEIQVNRASK